VVVDEVELVVDEVVRGDAEEVPGWLVVDELDVVVDEVELVEDDVIGTEELLEVVIGLTEEIMLPVVNMSGIFWLVVDAVVDVVVDGDVVKVLGTLPSMIPDDLQLFFSFCVTPDLK